MSGEFCGTGSGYFHWYIEAAAAKHKGGNYEITRLLGELLEHLDPVLRAAAYAEACDTGLETLVEETIPHVEPMRRALLALDGYVAPFRSLMQMAAREALRGELAQKADV